MYTATGAPDASTRGLSDAVRNEFLLVEQGMLAAVAGQYALPYAERSNTATTITTTDRGKAIRVTGAGNSVQAFASVATLGAGWFCWLWNDTTGYIETTTDGATYRMYPGEERCVYVDHTNSILRTRVTKSFRIKTQVAGAGTFYVPPGYNGALCVRATGAGAGGGGGGGGGSGKGVNSSGGNGGAGGSGGAAGQNGQTVLRRIAWSKLPAAGQTIAWSVGTGGAKGTGGAGGAGAASGGSGNTGSDGTSGSAGTATSFATSTDDYYANALGGTAGTNRGLAGAGAVTSPNGGAAVTNNATVTAAALDARAGFITTANSVGAASTAGTNSATSTGKAGGAGGDTPTGWALPTARSGASLAPGGATNSNAVPSPGNPGTTPAAETSPGVGGLGGGGGGGSPGVGGGASAATGAGGAGGDGANGGPGEIEIWAE